MMTILVLGRVSGTGPPRQRLAPRRFTGRALGDHFCKRARDTGSYYILSIWLCRSLTLVIGLRVKR